MSNYYTQTLYVPLVDEQGNVIGKGERWDVHKRGILHKGFTVRLLYKNLVLLQKRKHPMFDHVIDMTSSSHPLVTDDGVQDEQDAVISCLKREWNLELRDRKKIVKRESFLYKASDSVGFTEHEYCTMYDVKLLTVPAPDFAYCYGYELVELDYVTSHHNVFNFAPWVRL